MNNKMRMIVGIMACVGLLRISLQPAAEPRHLPLSDPGPLTLPDHLIKQNTAAKLKLYGVASRYLNSLWQYQLAVKAYLAWDVEEYQATCRIIALHRQACPPPLSPPNPLDHLQRIDQAAAELAKAQVVFKSEIRLLALHACQEVGQLCNLHDPNSTQALITRLPATAYDSILADALAMLPHTREVFSAISQEIEAKNLPET